MRGAPNYAWALLFPSFWIGDPVLDEQIPIGLILTVNSLLVCHYGYMFAGPRNAWAVPVHLLRGRISIQARRNVSALKQEVLRATTPVAKRLSETGLWNWGRWGEKGKERPKADKSRVNVVQGKLCG